MSVHATPLAERLAVQVHGLSLDRPLSRSIEDELRELMWNHSVLVFRNQRLEPGDQARVVDVFGPAAHENEDGLGYALVSDAGLLSNARLPFHMDQTFLASPYLFLSLYGVALKGVSAPTIFVSQTGGYAALPESLRQRIQGMETIHLHPSGNASPGNDLVRTMLDGVIADPEKSEYPTIAEYPRRTWPIVTPHHKTGAPMLFVTEMLSHIAGLDPVDGEALLAELYGYLYAPENTYVHQWAEGDLVIWDNLAVQHGRPSFSGTDGVRTLRRIVATEQRRSLRAMYAFTGVEYPRTFDAVTREQAYRTSDGRLAVNAPGPRAS
jgi:taurine dioxygenase